MVLFASAQFYFSIPFLLALPATCKTVFVPQQSLFLY